ncbi:MAG: DUF943 family protein [Pantoea sp.]|nr:DUF943 family protein [Pantoea sp.]
MQRKDKLIYTLLLLGCIPLGYALWLYLHPAKIVAVHQDANFSSVLVKNFPLTDQGKISWWLENKDMLKKNYGIPKPASYGSFTINFWDFGDGYKNEGKLDRRCFDDIKNNTKCIDKNLLFSVKRIKHEQLLFIVYQGGNYRLEENKLIGIKDK